MKDEPTEFVERWLEPTLYIQVDENSFTASEFTQYDITFTYRTLE
jgi:hypothetical protein